MKDLDIKHTTLSVTHLLDDRYGLYWADEDGNNREYICCAFGFSNAIRVARGIGYQQVECVVTPCFESDYEREEKHLQMYETQI